MTIVIPSWMRVERPMCTALCEVVNEQLEKCPNMSLKDFAEYLDGVNKNEALKRLQSVERRQFRGDVL